MFRAHASIVKSIRCSVVEYGFQRLVDGWWSWEPLRRSCVRCGWCRARHHPHRTHDLVRLKHLVRIVMKFRLGVPHANLSSSSSFVQMGSVTVPFCSRTQNNPTLIARRGRSSVLKIRTCQLRESGFGDARNVMYVNETTMTYFWEMACHLESKQHLC